jgi:hypothetical protein
LAFDPTFTEAVERCMRALSRRRMGEAIKWVTDLMYYSSMRGLEDEYMKTFEFILREVERQPMPFPERFAESLNRKLEDISMGSEAVYLRRLLDGAEEVKREKLGKYLTVEKEIREKVKRFLEKELGWKYE